MSSIQVFVSSVMTAGIVRCTGSKTLEANETINSERNVPVGEWTSGVLDPSTSGSYAACFMFDIKLEEFAKRINVTLIYKDVNNSVHEASLIDYDTGMKYAGAIVNEMFGTFEFYLTDVVQYQVIMF